MGSNIFFFFFADFDLVQSCLGQICVDLDNSFDKQVIFWQTCIIQI